MATDLYLDSSAFDHLAKAGTPGIPVSIEEAGAFRSRIAAGEYRVLLSLHNLEEALGLILREPTGARGLLRAILGIATPLRVFKEPRVLMEEAVRAAAAGSAPPDPFIPDPAELLDPLKRVLRGPALDDPELKMVAKQTAEQIDDFREGMREAQTETGPELRSKLANVVFPFPEFVRIVAVDMAKDFITRIAPDANLSVAARGLLGLPFAKTYVEASCSLQYAQMFEKHAPQRGDSRDLFHAGLADFADDFIIHDAKLARHLLRLPSRRFSILTVRQLLAEV